MTYVLIGGSAFLGGVLFALLGWLESSEAFNKRKFGASALRSFIGAIGVMFLFDYMNTKPPMSYLLAFIAGLGSEEGIKRLVAIAQVFWQKTS